MIVSYGGSLKHDDPIVEEMRLKGQWCNKGYVVSTKKSQKTNFKNSKIILFKVGAANRNNHGLCGLLKI